MIYPQTEGATWLGLGLGLGLELGLDLPSDHRRHLAST